MRQEMRRPGSANGARAEDRDAVDRARFHQIHSYALK